MLNKHNLIFALFVVIFIVPEKSFLQTHVQQQNCLRLSQERKTFRRNFMRIINHINNPDFEPVYSRGRELNKSMKDSLQHFFNRYERELANTLPCHDSLITEIQQRQQMTQLFYQRCIQNKHKYFLVLDFLEMLKQKYTKEMSPEKVAWFLHLDIDLKHILLLVFRKHRFIQSFHDEIYFEYIHANPQSFIKYFRELHNPLLKDKIVLALIAQQPYIIEQTLMTEYASFQQQYRDSKNSIIQTLIEIKPNKSFSFLFPFIKEIAEKKISVQHLISISKTPYLYYHQLIETHLEHLKKNKDSVITMRLITTKMNAIADEYFITPMNNYHYLPDDKRFKIIRPLSTVELYYIIIAGSDKLYTSSFMYVYKKMIQQMGNRDRMLLFENVHYDQYRRFIQTLATYNFLHGHQKIFFLNPVSESEKKRLFDSFITNINIDPTHDLDDVIDVIQSFHGVQDTSLMRYIGTLLNNLGVGYEAEKNKKGILIADILKTIWGNAMNELSMRLNGATISPQKRKETMPNTDLKRLDCAALFESPLRHTIYEQVFFYSDDDALHSFNYLIYTFRKKNWIIRNFEHWVVIESKAGNRIQIYVNKPQYLDTSQYLSSQITLKNFLDKNHIQPTIFVHRGHSYFLTNTIHQISSEAKLIFLGSCGSQNLLGQILKISPYAQLISTRQIANSVVNSKVFYRFNEQLRLNRNILWEDFWASLKKEFKGTKNADIFDEYIPPYDNLSSQFFRLYYQRLSELY